MSGHGRTSTPVYRSQRFWLAAVVLAWGVQAIATQSLLLREALVLMSGSELAWGVVLFAWLLGVAAGAWLGGALAGRITRVELALVLVLAGLSTTGCVDLWVFRGARAWLSIGPGELLPLGKTALAAMLFVSPAGLMVGAAFPLACSALGTTAEALTRPRGAGPLAIIYALESAGSLLGGAAFSFWAVEHLAPIQTALACGALSMAAAAGLLGSRKRGPWAWALPPVLLAVAAMLVCVLGGDALNKRLVQSRWRTIAPGYALRAEGESRYQNLAIGQREDQYTLYCDGQVTADFPDPYTFAPLAHLWMCQHPSPRRVLVLGGGAEGLLAEILKHPIEHVDYVEPDPRQIELVRPFLPEADRAALADERVTIHHLDPRYVIKTMPPGRFDLVLARLPEPTSAMRARLYTNEFYGELRRAMSERSVLCTMAAATPTRLSEASAEYLASIRATLGRHFPCVTVGWGNPAQVLAATDTGLVLTDPQELTRRYVERAVASALFDPLLFGATDALDTSKIQQRAEELDAVVQPTISTDLHPAVYVQRLALWERQTGGQSGWVLSWLRSVRWAELVAVLAVVGAVTIIAHRVRARSRRGWASGAIVWSVATTGFATMALSIIWLFAFQNLYGYVYQRIGWIIAVFMGGLVVGCGVVSWRARGIGDPGMLNRYLWRGLIGVDVTLALAAVCAPVLLPRLGAIQTTPAALVLVEAAVSLMVALTGVLGGAAFALAGGLRLASGGQAGAAAGSVVGADHAGACAGALLTGLLLVPVFGTAATAFLLAGVKLCSAGVLISLRRLAGV